MSKTKRNWWKKISIRDLIALLASVMAVIGWALLIKANLPSGNEPPVIQNFQLSRDTVPVGGTVSARVIVKDTNLPDDEIHYFWAAHLGRIGEQLNRFEGPQVTYVAPDQLGVDFITVMVHDREGETDKDFIPITITERRRKQIIVGNKNFTEQYIVGQLMKQLLEDHGFAVKLVSDRYSPDLRRRMKDGDIDICTEYSGTAWMVHLGHKYEPGMDSNEVYRLVKEEEEDNGLIWLKPMWNNNTYALASWPEFTQKHDLRTLSDLAALYRQKQGKIKTSVGLEFSTRPDGLPALGNYYNFKVSQPYILTKPVAAPKQSLEKGLSDVAMVFGTDPEVAKYRWHVYTDDKNFFPPYDLTPYVRKEILDRYPEIASILNELVVTFPGGGEPATPEIVAECQKVWQELNAKVTMDGMEPDEVAHEYLVKNGLVKE